jgi:hypothetical protein
VSATNSVEVHGGILYRMQDIIEWMKIWKISEKIQNTATVTAV